MDKQNNTVPESNVPESSDSLYLQKLSFKKEDGKAMIGFFIHRFRVVLMLIFAMFLWGGLSLASLPLESDPEVEIPVGVVTVGLPGASPADVEELVIKRIEPRLANLSGLETLTSSARNSFATISLEFNASEDIDDAMRRLREAVESAKSELPEDASDPTVSQVAFEDTPVWTMVLTGPYDNFTLREYAEIVQEELESLSGTNAVRISGGDIRQIRVSYDVDKLQQHNLSIDQINGVVSATNLGLPLGTIDVSNFNYTVRAEGKFLTAAELRELPVSVTPEGQILRLRDVADVFDRAQKTDSTSQFSIEGGELQNALTLSVVKKVGANIVQLIDEGKVVLDQVIGTQIPADVSIETTLDFSQDIRTNITDLSRNGLATIVLVVLMLFLFVGFKEAFLAGLAIPMVFAITFGIMSMMGVTLNFLSLFSLILSLGMLVDNAIVVLQASKQYIRTGKFTPEEALLLVFKDFKYILIATTLTTVWAFLPLLLSTGIIGQFIRSIPITVSATLIASLLVAFFVNHPLAVVLERLRLTRSGFWSIFAGLLLVFLMFLGGLFSPGAELVEVPVLILLGAILATAVLRYRSRWKAELMKNEDLLIEEKAFPRKIRERLHKKYVAEDAKKGWGHRLYTGLVKIDSFLPTYERMLRFLMKTKLRTFAVLLMVFVVFAGSVALPATGVLKPEFLPPTDFEFMYVNIEGAPGLVSERTRQVADKVTDVLREQDVIENFSIVVGSAGSDLTSFSSVASGGDTNRAQFSLLLKPFDERPVDPELGRPQKSFEFAQDLRAALDPIEGAKITVQEISGGPPSGADFETRIAGDDLMELERLANEYLTALQAISGTVDESTSLELNPGEFTLRFDYDALQLRGLTTAQVASTLRTALSGAEVTKIYGDGEDISVIAEFQDSQIESMEDLLNLTLSNGRGQLYRVRDVADVELGASLTGITRIDQKRVISLSAKVEAPQIPAVVQEEFLQYVEEHPLPDGYEFVFGGANETTEESILSIFNAMIVALILIIGTLIVQLNSFRKTFIVLVTIPFAATGVFFGLLLLGWNLTFPVLIGVLALFGIVINNAIILVDKIGRNIEVGIPFTESIIDGAKSRLEAIFLTSVATIIGMIPLTISDEIWGGLGASLIFGLSTSLVLTLIVIPILYNLLLKKTGMKEAKIHQLKEQRASLS